MEGVREFLERLRNASLVNGHFLGILHLVIGRRISMGDGTVVSSGITWRQLAELLRVIRWDKDCVRELGLDPDELPPRDRQRYWYSAIVAAKVDSLEARQAAEKLIKPVGKLGYSVGPHPSEAK